MNWCFLHKTLYQIIWPGKYKNLKKSMAGLKNCSKRKEKAMTDKPDQEALRKMAIDYLTKMANLAKTATEVTLSEAKKMIHDFFASGDIEEMLEAAFDCEVETKRLQSIIGFLAKMESVSLATDNGSAMELIDKLEGEGLHMQDLFNHHRRRAFRDAKQIISKGKLTMFPHSLMNICLFNARCSQMDDICRWISRARLKVTAEINKQEKAKGTNQ